MAKKIFMGPWVHLQKILKSGSYIYEHVEIFRHYAKASWHDSGWTVIFNIERYFDNVRLLLYSRSQKF